MMKDKPLTADSITGAIFRSVNTRTDKHWATDEEVVQITFKTDKDSSASYNVILDQKAAEKLSQYLSIAFL